MLNKSKYNSDTVPKQAFQDALAATIEIFTCTVHSYSLEYSAFTPHIQANTQPRTHSEFSCVITAELGLQYCKIINVHTCFWKYRPNMYITRKPG